MDIRKFRTRFPEPGEMFHGTEELNEEEIKEVKSDCNAILSTRRRYELDTRIVQNAEKDITNVIDSWKEIDISLNSMMDDILTIGIEAKNVFKNGPVDEVQTVRQAMVDLRTSIIDMASHRLDALVNDAKISYERREVMKDSLGDCRRDGLCPICMSKDLAVFMIPCGHVFCSLCAEQVKDTCFTCRASVTSKNKLYFQ